MLAPFIVLAFFLRYLIKRHNSSNGVAGRKSNGKLVRLWPDALAAAISRIGQLLLQRGIRKHGHRRRPAEYVCHLGFKLAAWAKVLSWHVTAWGQIVIAKKTK
jgi:hypothetical protein